MFNNYAKKRHESNNNSFPITEIISLVEDQDNSEYSQWWFLWQVVLDWNNQFLSFLQSCPFHPTSCQNNMIQGWTENFEPIFHQSFNVENIKFALCILTKRLKIFMILYLVLTFTSTESFIKVVGYEVILLTYSKIGIKYRKGKWIYCIERSRCDIVSVILTGWEMQYETSQTSSFTF